MRFHINAHKLFLDAYALAGKHIGHFKTVARCCGYAHILKIERHKAFAIAEIGEKHRNFIVS